MYSADLVSSPSPDARRRSPQTAIRYRLDRPSPETASGSGIDAGGDATRSAPGVVVERTPAADDTDTATRQTIERMCEYIRMAIADPVVRACADYAWKKFGQSSPTDEMKVWAVWWYVKHCVRFRLDEATMFRVGLEAEQDLLIDPRLLVRMREPAEDCDGFSMLGAALASILGVPVCLATAAVSPDDRRRWSHVFPIAVTKTAGVIPMDISHGPGPGWMVPRERIYRFQAWGLDGRPIDIAPARFRGLHGYVRTGLSQFEEDWGGGGAGAADVWLTDADYNAGLPGGGGSGWDPQFFQGLIQQGVNIAGKVFTPPSYQSTVRDPVTGALLSTTIRNATPSTAMTAGAGGLANISPVVWWVGGGLLALVALSALKGNR